MKTAIYTLISILAIGSACGQSSYDKRYNQSSGSILQGNAGLSLSAPAAIPVKDPLRVVANIDYSLTGADASTGWVEFSGRVWDVQSGGICIHGFYTGCVMTSDDGCDFFVANFPYEMANDERIGRSAKTPIVWLAKVAGTHSYTTVSGGNRTLRKLDYGEIYQPKPLTPEQLALQATNAAIAKAKAKASIEQGKARALKLNQDQAAKGDPIGLVRMAERYRDGEGVEKDLAKAKEYFQKAIDAGDPSAAEELKRLNPPEQ